MKVENPVPDFDYSSNSQDCFGREGRERVKEEKLNDMPAILVNL